MQGMMWNCCVKLNLDRNERISLARGGEEYSNVKLLEYFYGKLKCNPDLTPFGFFGEEEVEIIV